MGIRPAGLLADLYAVVKKITGLSAALFRGGGGSGVHVRLRKQPKREPPGLACYVREKFRAGPDGVMAVYRGRFYRGDVRRRVSGELIELRRDSWPSSFRAGTPRFRPFSEANE